MQRRDEAAVNLSASLCSFAGFSQMRCKDAEAHKQQPRTVMYLGQLPAWQV